MSLRENVWVTIAAVGMTGAAFAADHNSAPLAASPGRPGIEKVVGSWGERPRLAARQMMMKYGDPQEVSSEQLIWHNQGRFKRIVVTKLEIPHDFPKPHMDYLAHTIEYRVPAKRASPLIDFDGSVAIDRTAGEMTARCDLEGHNILTLNLANDVATGKKDAAEARKVFGQIVVEDALGKNPPYITALQFEPATMAVADPGKPSIPGAPMRGQGQSAEKGDPEVLGFLVAINDNEILAAAEAEHRKVSPPVLEYAKMLHNEHGQNLGKTMKLAESIKVTAVETAAVDALRVKQAGELGMLVMLDDAKFGPAFIEAMVKGHTEVLAMIDGELLKAASNDALKVTVHAHNETVADGSSDGAGFFESRA